MADIMMTTPMADDVSRYARPARESLSSEDFETASIRSAAPSYTSDAPSYHSTNPHPDPLPPYSPPARSTPPTTTTTTTRQNSSVSSLLDPVPSPSSSSTTTTAPRRYGLPPVPTGPPPQDFPSLSQFRIPPWSTANSTSNPTARIYHNVALRRAASVASSSSSSTANLDGLMRRVMLERIEEEERYHNSQQQRVRPLEDPYLVGEEAAARARAERMAREENWGEEVLIREDRRWDWFLAQMKDREERERSWKRFRRDIDRRSNSRLPFRIGARF
ncbi:hypothetical protein N657DRAFT_643650 [Parathielavia appendiculata]|uniref:Uncharacterized protein n=1 Tax=Parathielavia appendiculata TaxID=2587402 RepID=A0AAN6U1U6_9PEZI|nr:hypothetical protein N657DRAFT_643650 [Parathielavia appendiculata]